MSTKTLNWKAILFWGFIIGGIVLALIFRNEVIVWVQGVTKGLNFPTEDLVGKVTGYIQEKPLESLLAVGSAGATIFGLYETIEKRRADNKTNEIALAKIQSELVSDSKIGEAQSLVEQYRKQAEEYKSQLNDTTAKETIADLQKRLDLEAEKAKRLRGDLDYLQRLKTVTPKDFEQMLKDSKKIGQ